MASNPAGAADQQSRARTLEDFCAAPDVPPAMDGICTARAGIEILRQLAIWTLALSLLFPLVVYAAGRIAQKSRELLLDVFSPGLKISILAVSLLLVIQAVLLIGAIYYAGTSSSGRIHGRLILLIGATAIAAVSQIIAASRGVVRQARAVVMGKLIRRSTQPRLYDFIEDTARRIGTEAPRNVVIGLDPSFFVTEADVQCFDGEVHGRTLYVSAPLCRILTLEELKAVLAHELAHFHGEDTKFSLRFYPIYRGCIDSLEAASTVGEGSWFRSLLLMPALNMLAFFLECFSAAEKKISRERELAADAVAANVAGGRTFAIALVKVVIFSLLWQRLLEALYAALQKEMAEIDGKPELQDLVLSNVSTLFGDFARSHATPELLRGLDQVSIPHPTDSHPPLATRLEAVGVRLADIGPEALNADPPVPASSLIAHMDRIEGWLTQALQASMLNLPMDAAGEMVEPQPVPSEAPPSGDPPRSEASSAPGAASAPMRRRQIQVCPSCGVRVLPMADGSCPSCRRAMES
ncbi:MAG: M48 family metalloprotease [Bryobacteraceae bacterium]|nr:M48 family metalloprotease [Bryobacteraceae bacterium]